jgi:2-iminobutanoate/2-iminopropanoate deaminase
MEPRRTCRRFRICRRHARHRSRYQQAGDGDEARIRQAFLNMKAIVAAAGGGLRDAVRLVVYVTDMDRYRPLVNKIQEEFWGGGPYPPRSIVEVSRLNQDDIVEVEGTFFCPLRGAG